MLTELSEIICHLYSYELVSDETINLINKDISKDDTMAEYWIRTLRPMYNATLD